MTFYRSLLQNVIKLAKTFVPIFLFLLVLISLHWGLGLECLVAACDGGRGSSSVAAEFHPAGEPREETPPPPPIPRAVLVPELVQPLLPDNLRMVELQQRLSIYFIGRHDRAHLPQFLGILEKQMLLEKRIEAALVRDGYAPDSIFAKRGEIRGIVLNHPTRGVALSESTLNRYLSQIERDGTRLSTPYSRVMRAIGNLNLLIRRNNE
ncbi:unnamed protein product [Coffea canephora]|uniref:DH200=94 genomic scaffold, scaffold_159 n=1 Tax=Coffea canephora TaxID=49390 RepID=A0A068VCK6_COFCA|nr:unnamed protein product [Coffea canephora]